MPSPDRSLPDGKELAEYLGDFLKTGGQFGDLFSLGPQEPLRGPGNSAERAEAVYRTLPKRLIRFTQAAVLAAASTFGILLDRQSTVLANQCQYLNGFAQVVSHNPQIPACLDNEHFNGKTRRVEQNTANGGLLEWDSKTNTITFKIKGETQEVDSDGLLYGPNSKCTIRGSFRHLAVARPDIVGRCLIDAHPDPINPKNIIQETSKGTLWQIGNLTYFNNGNATYLLGDRAIYERANSDSCPGETGSQTTTPCREVPLLINHIYTQENTVALSFDDGWSEEAIREMAEAIISTGNRATFFINGRYFRTYKNLILELDKTGKIYFANHTDNHLDLGQLAKAERWDLIDQEVKYGDPRVNIPELVHYSRLFRFPGFSDNSISFSTNSDLRRMIVFDRGYTIVDSDQGNFDYTNQSQSFVDRRLIMTLTGQIFYGHLLPRNIATFKVALKQLNQRGIFGDDIDDMLDKSLVRSIYVN